jgi:hypothetical protein
LAGIATVEPTGTHGDLCGWMVVYPKIATRLAANDAAIISFAAKSIDRGKSPVRKYFRCLDSQVFSSCELRLSK